MNWFHKLIIKVINGQHDGLLNLGVVYLRLKILAQCIFLFVLATSNPLVRAEQPSPAASMAEFCRNLPRPAYQNLERIKSTSSWFELYKVAPGVTAIYEPHQWQEVISYLIEGEDEALLFDTGNGIGKIKRVVDELTNKPVTVVNSHSHYDHVGGNYEFENVLALDNSFSKARQRGHKNEDIRIEVSPAALCTELPDGVSEKTHTGRPYEIKGHIADGHVFDLGGRQLEIIQVPGHTPDALALIDRSAGLLFTGDTYYSGPIWLYAPETDLDAYQASLLRLIKEVPNLKMLLPAHNTPSVNPAVLYQVDKAFRALRAGELKALPAMEGTVVYKVDGETEFSFLLREDMLNKE